MTQHDEHIATRRKLRNVALCKDFELLLSMCTLSDTDKTILRMHYLKDQDFRYIGDALGLAEQTVKIRHRNAPKKIKQAIEL